MRFLAVFLAFLLTATAAEAATTTKFTVTNAAWTDLGAGPMLLSFRGTGVYAVSDTTPSLVQEGFGVAMGDSVAINTTSHVWAMAKDAANVDAYVAPISGGGSGGGGGITSITAGTTPTTGFAAGELMMSDGAKAQPPNGAIVNQTLTWRNSNPAYDNTIGMLSNGFNFELRANSPGGALDVMSVPSTNPALIKAYNTYTDGSNFEWGGFDWVTAPNVLTIGTNKSGTGQVREVRISNGVVSGFRITPDNSEHIYGPLYLDYQTVIQVGNGYLSIVGFGIDTPTFWGNNVLIKGTQPTITGAGGTCATSTKVGGATAGTVVLSGVCATGNTIAFTGMPSPATNGYACDAEDRTTRTALFVQSASTTTGFTLTTGAVSSVAGDVLQWKCMGY
jgi:hypothetical protein